MPTTTAAPPPIPPPLPSSFTKPVAYRFSDIFIEGLPKRQSELEFVDVLVSTDLPLFVDPFALKIGTDPFAITCHDLVFDYFQELIDAIRGGKSRRIKDLLHNLHEPNETRLGLSHGPPRGRGIGAGQARQLEQAFANSTAAKSGLLQDLADCELFIEGIGHDKISDITINVIRDELVTFTQAQCSKWGVETEKIATGFCWNNDSREWQNRLDWLPIYNGLPILLIPKSAVRYHLAIDDKQYYNTHVIGYFQSHHLRQENLRSSDSLEKVLRGGRRQKKITKKELRKEHPFSKKMLLEFTDQHPEVFKHYKEFAKRTAERAPSSSGIHEKAQKVARDENKILFIDYVGEINVYVNQGNVAGSMGSNSVSVNHGDITQYRNDIDASTKLDTETKMLLKKAMDVLESTELSADLKSDAKTDLVRVKEELAKPKPSSATVLTYLDRLAAVCKPVADILKVGGAVAAIVTATGS